MRKGFLVLGLCVLLGGCAAGNKQSACDAAKKTLDSAQVVYDASVAGHVAPIIVQQNEWALNAARAIQAIWCAEAVEVKK